MDYLRFEAHMVIVIINGITSGVIDSASAVDPVLDPTEGRPLSNATRVGQA